MNVNVGVVSVVAPVGPPVMFVGGPTVSTEKLRSSRSPGLPAPSKPCTRKTCGPSASGADVNGLVHGPKLPSMSQLNVTASADVNVNVGVVSDVGPLGRR